MDTLPIFPVSTVLLPGTEMSLRILEPRYRLMLEDCLQSRKPFGVVYCPSHDDDVGTLSAIGCVARIVNHSPFHDGTYTVMVEGSERFRIGEVENNREYMCAVPELLQDEQDIPLDDPLIDSVEQMMMIYEDLLADIDPAMVRGTLSLPVRREDSFRVIEQMLLPEDMRDKALQISSVRKRFELSAKYLRVEIERLKFLLTENDNDPLHLN